MDPQDAHRDRPGNVAARRARRVLALLFTGWSACLLPCTCGASACADEEPQEAATKAEEDKFVERFRRAQSLLGRGSDEEAEKLLKELVAERPLESAVHHALGVLHQFRKRPEAAANELATAAKLAPDDAVIRRDCGMHLLGMGRAADALPHLARARALVPKDVETLVGYGAALRALGRLDAAEKAYREAVAAEPNSVDAAVGLAACIVAAKPAEALKLVLPATGRWVDVLLVRGLALEGLGRLDEACKELVDAAKAAPPGPGGAMFLRDIAEALVRCGFAAEAEPVAVAWCGVDIVDRRPSVRASFCLAVVRAAAGRPQDALAALDAATPLEKEAVDVRARVSLFRAAMLLEAGRGPEATALLEPLAGATDERFERWAALRLLSRLSAEEFAARVGRDAQARALANDVEWIESLAARLRGDAAEVERRRARAAELSSRPGEYPGALVRPPVHAK